MRLQYCRLNLLSIFKNIIVVVLPLLVFTPEEYHFRNCNKENFPKSLLSQKYRFPEKSCYRALLPSSDSVGVRGDLYACARKSCHL